MREREGMRMRKGGRDDRPGDKGRIKFFFQKKNIF